MNEDWLKDIHDKMADYQVAEPQGLWDDIRRASLSNERASSIRRTPVFVKMWIKRASAVAALLAILVSVGYLWRYNKQTSIITPMAQVEPAAEVSPQEHVSPVPVSDYADSILPTTPHDNLIAAVPQLPQHAVKDNFSVPSEVPAQGKAMNETETEAPVMAFAQNKVEVHDEAEDEKPQHDAPQNETRAPSSASNRGVNRDQSLSRYKSNKQHSGHLAQAKVPKSSRFAFGVYTGGNGFPSLESGSSGDFSNGSSAMAAPVYGDPAGEVTPVYNIYWRDNPKLGVLLLNQGKQMLMDYDHHFPVRTGITFAYHFNQRTSLESGVTYAYLTSDFHVGSYYHYVTGKQSLHYIGVPLNLKYIFYSWKGLDLYVSTGVLGEKSVSGRVENNYVLNQQVSMSETEDLEEKPFQWSFNASAGVQYNITPVVGLYAEPGVSYYLDDGTNIETIYKEKPLNFNLNFGIRFNFGK